MNARHILEESGAREIHVGLGNRVDSPMRFRNPRIAMGNAPEREYQLFQVLEENVRRLSRAVSLAG